MNSTGLIVTNQSQLMQVPQENSTVVNGSYVVLACMNGYMNTGGSLNVTCSSSGTWSLFPNCILNSSNNGLSTTTLSTNMGAACAIDNTILNITNGYYSNMSLSYTSNTTATGINITILKTVLFFLII